jgi:2'-5' RNA ligase
MEYVRTFIAIHLSEALRGKVSELQEILKKSGARVKWVENENLHITLKFLGGVERQKLQSIFDACCKVGESFYPFVLGLGSLGAFPSLKNPRVIWIGIEKGREEIQKLAKELNSNLEQLGFKSGEEFKPHLTIGRVKGTECREKLIEKITNTIISVGELKVDRIYVMKSQLTREGPIYTIMKECLFKGVGNFEQVS